MIPLDVVLFYLFGGGGGGELARRRHAAQPDAQRADADRVVRRRWPALYINLDSPFTAVTQIIVYAGAIMVLFLFVVMLLNAPREDVASPYGPAYVTLTTGPRKAFAVLSVILLGRARAGDAPVRQRVAAVRARAAAAHVSSVREIGIAIFTDYSLAFEATSVLILVAMVGAVVLAKKKL